MLNKHFSTHAICLTGALVFLWLKLPLPWLFGPLASCLIAALFGAQLYSVKILSDSMRTILGVAAGSTVTVTFITAIPSLWNTLILIPIMVILIGFMGVWYFQKICGYDFPTAYYASMPGGLQDMLAFGEEAGGNIRAMLFENITPQTFLTMQEHIKDVITAHEPRADVIDVYIAQTSQEHEVQVTIVFRVVNVQEPVTLELLLERVR